MSKMSNIVDVYVGARLRMRRTMLGMSQSKLGELLGVTFQQVQKYEKGSNRISASRLQHTARVLEVSPGYFFEGAPAQSAELGFAEEQIDDFIRNSIANLIWVPFGHGFTGKLVILTSHIANSPAGAPTTLRGLTSDPGRAGGAFASGRSVRQAEFGRIVRFTERTNRRRHRLPTPAKSPDQRSGGAPLGREHAGRRD